MRLLPLLLLALLAACALTATITASRARRRHAGQVAAAQEVAERARRTADRYEGALRALVNDPDLTSEARTRIELALVDLQDKDRLP